MLVAGLLHIMVERVFKHVIIKKIYWVKHIMTIETQLYIWDMTAQNTNKKEEYKINFG